MRHADGILVIAGAAMVAGGTMHPMLPNGDTGAVLSSGRWALSHWVLSFGQAAAIAGLAAWTGRAPKAGVVLACLGFALGVLGTLSAATALPMARGDALPAVAAWTLGLGRACMVLVGAGALIMGAAAWRTHTQPTWLSVAMTGAGSVALLAAAAVPDAHPWFHDVILRAGALVSGLMLVALAWHAEATPDD